MSLFSWLFAPFKKSVEPNWYPPTPEPEDESPQTPYRTAPDRPIEDIAQPIDATSEIQSIFMKAVEKRNSISDKDKKFLEKRRDLLINKLAEAMLDEFEDNVKDDGRAPISYTSFRDYGMSEDKMYLFYQMAYEAFLPLGIKLEWVQGYQYIWVDRQQIKKALKNLPLTK
jgi:hypothetical protein